MTTKFYEVIEGSSIIEVKAELEWKKPFRLSTSRSIIYPESYHLATFVLYDKKNNIFSVVQDPYLRYLYYGNLFRLNDGVISNGFEQFFPYYEDFIYGTEPEDVSEEKTIVKNAFENNSVKLEFNIGSLEQIVKSRKYRLEKGDFNDGIYIFNNFNPNINSSRLTAFLNLFVLGGNSIKKNPYIDDYFYLGKLPFEDSFFGILRRESNSNIITLSDSVKRYSFILEKVIVERIFL